MKSNWNKIYLALAFSLVVFTGCEKYLDIEPEFTEDAENYFNTPDQYELALIGAYDLMQGSFLHVWIGEIASDNAIAGGESFVDTKGLHEIDDMNHGAVNEELRNVFRWNYAGVNRCNFILENKNKINFDGKDKIIGETHFLRAYYYFQLVKFFGGVPLIIDERLGTEEAKDIDRSSAAQVYSQIETDLIFAASQLEWTNPVKGRVGKGAALSLLGKVYLYQNKFSQAASILDQVINDGPYSLIPDYTRLFAVSNEGHSETILDVEYSGLEGGSYDCLICLEGNAAPGFQGIRQYNGPIYGDGNSYNLPTADLYNSFAVEDTIRKTSTVLDIDSFIAARPNQSIEYAVGGGGHTGYYNNKYIKRQGEIGLPDNDLTSPVNYKVIRYADVLLMAAEAHLQAGTQHSGKFTSNLGLVNAVRSRANVPDLTALTVQDVWAERRYELSGEGHRFFDLVRTGQAASSITNFVAGKHELFPIPQIEISLAGGNWNQNPGY